MDRSESPYFQRSRSDESPRRYNKGGRRDHSRRHSRSRSRSRNRSRDRRRRSRSRSRSRSRDRYSNRRSQERDLYNDIINEDYQDMDRDDRYNRNDQKKRAGYDNYRRNFNDRDRDRHKRYYSPDRDDRSDSYESDGYNDHYSSQQPNKIIILRGLPQHITEADINNELLQCGLQATSIRLIRKRKTGASRGFAFVEFSTQEEASRWMDYKQGNLMLQDHYRVVMQYSHSKEPVAEKRILTDWYCAKCGVFNFKRRENCFKCYASREESEKGGEGSDEVSNILTKKIMLRNLDVLTNEEGVLTVMQEKVPSLVSKIAKIMICRDPLTSTSRGICYLCFDNLVDSMNTHNSLKMLEPPLHIDNREVLVSYCVDSENKQITKPSTSSTSQSSKSIADPTTAYTANTYQYTLADVDRLAEYSASMYASTPAEHEHYVKYYTQYYIGEINKGHFDNLPTMNQLGESANSGAAVALSAIQRKQNKLKGNDVAAVATTAMVGPGITGAVQIPTGTDGKAYPTPDISLYQYDDTSGYYYDPLTGLYYDAHSQYYYNNETGSYLYWSPEHSTYLLASAGAGATFGTTMQPAAFATVAPAIAATTSQTSFVGQPELAKPPAPPTEEKKESKKDNKQDKVKVAKKIVKDMEKWAKQLNQKKDNFTVATPQPILTTKLDDIVPTKSSSLSSGYADVGFSILEKKEKGKLDMAPTPMMMSKLVSSYGSDSDDHEDNSQLQGYGGDANERDYVDFDKLTCLLCKRAFQSPEILQKHLKMSNLHKENLQKHNLARGLTDSNGGGSALSYRDRAKERRLKYGESDPPPPNRSKERFEKELKSVSSRGNMNVAQMPIGENNVGNRLLQKMGWSEGQGLGKSNQGRTKIIEADARSSTAGLGTKTSAFTPGDDYKSYIKRMMKSRYEQVDVKD